MPEDSAQEKTEPATQHRRDDARKKGQVARSSELNSFAILFFGTLFLLFTGPSLAHSMATLMREMLGGLATPPSNTGEFVGTVVHLGIRVLLMLAPLFMALISVAIVVNESIEEDLVEFTHVAERWDHPDPHGRTEKALASSKSCLKNSAERREEQEFDKIDEKERENAKPTNRISLVVTRKHDMFVKKIGRAHV